MCNINIVIQTKKGIEQGRASQIASLLTCATTDSFKFNSHGDGTYYSHNNLLIKSSEKVNLIDNLKEIALSKFIITHQRYATHGLTEKYIQPFENEDFVFVHNGIIASFVKEKDESDSFGFFREFNLGFAQETGKRSRRIIQTIKKTLKEVSGSFSIAILDKKTDILYYFKNSMTSMHYFKSNNLCFLTTSKDNGDYLEFISGVKFKERTFKDDMIYQIVPSAQDIKLYECGRIKKKVITLSEYNMSEYAHYKNYCSSDSYLTGTEEKIITPEDLTKEKIAVERCSFCQKDIYLGEEYDNYKDKVICFECMGLPTKEENSL